MHVLDPTTVDSLLDLGGRAFLLGVLDTYVADTTSRVETLRAELASADPGRIHRAAHAFKGASGSIGALAMQELCAETIRRADAGDVAGARALLPDVLLELDRIRGAVESLRRG